MNGWPSFQHWVRAMRSVFPYYKTLIMFSDGGSDPVGATVKMLPAGNDNSPCHAS